MTTALTWPVYSVQALAKAMRHTSFAPRDLYLDHRAPNLVRPLSGLKKWRVLGLSEEKAHILMEGGLEGELGQLVCNSIPLRMTRAVAQSECERIWCFQKARQARFGNTFTLMVPVAALTRKSLSATFLICIGLASPSVLVWRGDCIPGIVDESTQQ